MSEMRQILMGGALAAALIMPTLAHAGEDRTWVTRPSQSFSTHSLDLDHVLGNATITVTDSGPMTVQISGPRFLVDPMRVQAQGDRLTVEGPRNAHHSFSVWDWTKWFDYSDVADEHSRARIAITVPRGSDVNINKQIGDITMGDLDGHLYVEAINSDLKSGRVADAKIKIVGGGDTSITAVRGNLSIDVAGSGDVKVGNVGSADIEVAGSGDTDIGDVGGGLKASIAGSGDVSVGRVNGPVSLSLAGSGDVHILGGTADPFKVSMVGGGDVIFGGQANNPQISAIGSGDVWIKSYSGSMSSSGMADVHVGDGHFPPMKPPAPPSPPMPAPPAPPAPPAHH